MFWKEEPVGRFVAHPGNWGFESLFCYESGPFCGEIVVVYYIETLWYFSSKVKHVWDFGCVELASHNSSCPLSQTDSLFDRFKWFLLNFWRGGFRGSAWLRCFLWRVGGYV